MCPSQAPTFHDEKQGQAGFFILGCSFFTKHISDPKTYPPNHTRDIFFENGHHWKRLKKAATTVRHGDTLAVGTLFKFPPMELHN